jgi:hypothetical protein
MNTCGWCGARKPKGVLCPKCIGDSRAPSIGGVDRLRALVKRIADWDCTTPSLPGKCSDAHPSDDEEWCAACLCRRELTHGE